MMSGEAGFTAPHAVNEAEVGFDLKARRHGVCKFFNSQKGFGFINDDHPEELGHQEVFVHYSAISAKGGFRSLAEGEEVEYLLIPGGKGFQATEVSGPSGRAVQGDPRARLPRGAPNVLGYQALGGMGMIPYALAGGASPYMAADPYLQQQGLYTAAGASPYSHVLYVPTSAVGAQYAAAGMSPQTMSMAGGAGIGGLGGGMAGIRSPGQGYGQPGMALSPQLAGGFGGGFGAANYGAGLGGGVGGQSGPGEMRSPVAGSNGFGTPQGFGAGGNSGGLGLRGDGSGRQAGAGGADLRDDSRQGFASGPFGGNSLLYSSGAGQGAQGGGQSGGGY